MVYQQLSNKKALKFKNDNPNYNVYLSSPRQEMLFMVKDDGVTNFCREFSYLVNSNKSSIKFSEFCKNKNDYNVIFIQPDEID